VIGFFVAGKPETKGSLRAFMPKGWKRPVLTNMNPRAKAWAAVISAVALDAMTQGERDVIQDEVELRLSFKMPRPKAHYRTGRHADKLRPDAPERPATTPDLDKLVRCAADALTGVVFRDDSQVVRLVAEKVYGQTPGVWVEVYWPAEGKESGA
jgi:Holliday junction resolvase RusA-like endonuclease